MEFPAPPSPPSSPLLQPPQSPSIKIGVHVQICNEPPWRMLWRVVEIPLSHLSSCMAHDCRYYCRHDHTHRGGDPDCFRRAVSRVICVSDDETTDDLYGPCVVLGSKLYNFYHDNNKGQGHLFALDISHHRNHHHNHFAASTWTRVPIPTNYSHLSSRFPPVMVPISGKLCLLGVKPSPSIPPPTGGVETFGLIYDPSAAKEPEHNRWCEIQEPEQKKIKDSNNIVALSLGDSVGQILVVANPHPLYVHPKKHWKYKLSYDVGKKVWNTFSADQELLKLIQVVAGKVVTVEDETTLYAVDRNGFFCAYNWNDGDLASGPIVGLEHERMLHNLHETRYKVPLIRLGKDLFCLPWEDYDFVSDITHLHYSIGIVKRCDDNPYELTLFVVGCFCESFPGVVTLQDAFLL